MAHQQRREGDVVIHPCKTISELAAVLAGQVRLEIVALLAQGSRDVTSITATLGLDISHVSTNLRILRKRGLIGYKRDRRRRIYHLSKSIYCRTHDGLLHVEMVCSNGDRLSFKIMPPDDPHVAVCEVVKKTKRANSVR